jgi:hypothetical protein
MKELLLQHSNNSSFNREQYPKVVIAIDLNAMERASSNNEGNQLVHVQIISLDQW